MARGGRVSLSRKSAAAALNAVNQKPLAESDGERNRGAADSQRVLTPILEQSLTWVMNFLKVHPDQILITKANLEAGAMKGQLTAVMSITESNSEPGVIPMPEHFHKTYTTMKSIPKYYIGDFMVKECKFVVQFVNEVDQDPGALRAYFSALTGANENSPWNGPLHTRSVLTAWLRKMLKLLGNRHMVIGTTAVMRDGKLDSKAISPYELNWDPPEKDWAKPEWTKSDKNIPTLKSIRHRFFNVEVDVSQFHINPASWDATELWSDMNAKFVTEDADMSPTLASFFKGEAGKWKELFSKERWLDDAKAVAAQLDAFHETAAVGKTNVLTAAQDQKAERMKEARSKRAPPAKRCRTKLSLLVSEGGAVEGDNGPALK